MICSEIHKIHPSNNNNFHNHQLLKRHSAFEKTNNKIPNRSTQQRAATAATKAESNEGEMDTGETGLGAGASWAAERTAKRTAVRATMEDAFAIVDRVCTSVCLREFMVFEDAKRLKAQVYELR